MWKPTVHFGGPGAPPRALRQLLFDRITAARSGSSIDIVTYYFRDRALASALLRAHERGVSVRVTIDGRPRSPEANRAICDDLSVPLGSRFRAIVHPHLPMMPRRRLHEKLYVFSDPPVALIGSFNPSNNAIEAEEAIASEIGQHDFGYNSLVEFTDPTLVEGLTSHARAIHTGGHRRGERWLERRRSLIVGETQVHYWPRIHDDPARERLRAATAPGRLRLAASHLSGRTFPRELSAAVRRGLRVEVVSHANTRRFPEHTASELIASGVHVKRIGHEVETPMHEKFALLESADTHRTLFGSFNWNEQSRWFNHEVLVDSANPAVFEAYDRRWEQLAASQ